MKAECLHCLLTEVAPKALQVARGSALREKLSASTTTIAYARAYGIDAVVRALCERHQPIAKQVLAGAPEGATDVVTAANELLETARAYAFGAAREEDLTSAAIDFAQAHREDEAREQQTTSDDQGDKR